MQITLAVFLRKSDAVFQIGLLSSDLCCPKSQFFEVFYIGSFAKEQDFVRDATALNNIEEEIHPRCTMCTITLQVCG